MARTCCRSPEHCRNPWTPCKLRDEFERADSGAWPRGPTAEVRQRIAEKAARYEREMAQERQRNRMRGRDMGRTR